MFKGKEYVGILEKNYRIKKYYVHFLQFSFKLIIFYRLYKNAV